jgi:hypothetical protein
MSLLSSDYWLGKRMLARRRDKTPARGPVVMTDPDYGTFVGRDA